MIDAQTLSVATWVAVGVVTLAAVSAAARVAVVRLAAVLRTP